MTNPLRFLVLLFAIFAAVAAVWSLIPAEAQNRAATLVEEWKSDLHQADQQLRDGRCSDALATSSAALSSMQDNLAGGAGAGRLVATAELYKAVAEEGVARPDDAYWDWQTAWNLDHEVGGADLEVFGAAGASLHERTAPELAKIAGLPAGAPGPMDETPWARAHRDAGVYDVARDKDVTKPERIATPAPKYPAAERKIRKNGTMVVEAILDRTGKVADFHVRRSIDPLLDLAALDTLHQWRFKPALLAGKPVPVYYQLTISFRVESSHGD